MEEAFDFSLLLGPWIENREGTVSTSVLKNHYVGLFFVYLFLPLSSFLGAATRMPVILKAECIPITLHASWCGSCRQFSAYVQQAYKACRDQKKPFEIVNVSRDVNQDNYEVYKREFSWYNVPYRNEELREQLCRHFSVTSLPFFVVLDPKGMIVNLNARQLITDNPSGFPWREPSIYEILEPYLYKKETKVKAEEIMKKPLLLLFTTSWSHACQRFTVQLLTLYNKLKDQNKEFVVVMCCGDKKQAEFTNYVQSFPWYHLSFQCELFASLLSKYNVSGYPSCIIFDADGILCQINGVDVIMANNAIERYPWYPEPIVNVNEDPEGINNYPSVVLLCDKTKEIKEEEKENCIRLLRECGELSIQKKEYFKLKYFYADQEDNVSNQIRQLTNVQACPALVLLHLQDRGSYYLPRSQELTKENILQFVNDYMMNQLPRQQAISV